MADADGEEPVGVENVNVQEAQPKSDAGGNDSCIICYTNEPNIIIEPCGHGGMCQGCMLNLIQKERICPFCRKVPNFSPQLTRPRTWNIFILSK
jgi:hypothetical protein